MIDHPPDASIRAAASPRKPDHLSRRRRPPADILAAAGAMMRARREALTLSIGDVSRALDGVTVVFLAEVERGESGVGADIAERWAGVIGLDPAEVLCAFRVIPERAAAAFFDADRMRAALAGGGL